MLNEKGPDVEMSIQLCRWNEVHVYICVVGKWSIYLLIEIYSDVLQFVEWSEFVERESSSVTCILNKVRLIVCRK